MTYPDTSGPEDPLIKERKRLYHRLTDALLTMVLPGVAGLAALGISLLSGMGFFVALFLSFLLAVALYIFAKTALVH